MIQIHFMGVLGSGCSAVAAIAKVRGYIVTGCDTSSETEYSSELKRLGINPLVGHSSEHLADVAMLVMSPAISYFDDQNPELVTAQKQGIPIKTTAQFSGEVLQKDKFVIAICGTHGKSTTTALTALILEKAGLDPTVQLGATVPSWRANFRVGKSKYFVVEADEYGNSFLSYHVDIVAITNVEYDHPEFFATESDFMLSFEKFIDNRKPDSKVLVGSGVKAKLNVPNAQEVETQSLELTIPGEFNIANASMALRIAQELGIDAALARSVVADFGGLARRFELIGEIKGVKVFDDYGHHPTAITKTAQAAREIFGTATIWLVFQPHMFTRTKALFDDFVTALQSIPIDNVVVADIYHAREHDTGLISAKDIVDKVAKPHVTYGGSLAAIGKNLAERVKYGDIVICMGAGDIIGLSRGLIEKLG